MFADDFWLSLVIVFQVVGITFCLLELILVSFVTADNLLVFNQGSLLLRSAIKTVGNLPGKDWHLLEV